MAIMKNYNDNSLEVVEPPYKEMTEFINSIKGLYEAKIPQETIDRILDTVIPNPLGNCICVDIEQDLDNLVSIYLNNNSEHAQKLKTRINRDINWVLKAIARLDGESKKGGKINYSGLTQYIVRSYFLDKEIQISKVENETDSYIFDWSELTKAQLEELF